MSQTEDLYYLFEQIDATHKKRSIRAPFSYPGGKYKSLDKILPHLPHSKSYIEPFGGSGVVLLNKPRTQLDVFNDRYAGVVAFYRCMIDSEKLTTLITRLDTTVHAREEWTWCAETWESCGDDVERAARWYYMLFYSFGSLGRNWGRQTSTKTMAGRVRSKLKEFPQIHERFRNVQIENQDWRDCIRSYSNAGAVFYLDPPYLTERNSADVYKHYMSEADHLELASMIMDSKGLFVLSGYANDVYSSFTWDTVHSWDTFVSVKSLGHEGNNKQHTEQSRGTAQEMLWIKNNE